MSLNDPRWGNNQGNDDENKRGNNGRGDNQGPPDLEDVWRDFNQKLSGLFGSKKSGGGSGGDNRGPGGGGPNLPEFNFRHLSGGIGALAILLLVVWLASGFYTVDANERGVVLRFGEHVQTSEPGLNWRMPFPIESHQIVDVTGVRTVEVGYRGTDRNKVLRESLMLTEDANIVDIQFAVQYILSSPENYLFNNRFPDESVMQSAETAMREIVGRSSMDFVLYEGREDIAANAQELMQSILDRYETGILISRVTMQNAQPPEQVQPAFDDAIQAGQDRERSRNQGEAYRNDVVPRARGAASRLLEEANGYRERVIANASGEAERFSRVLAEYSQSPEVTRERLYLDTMQQVFSNTSKVMIDAQSSGNLMLMPLDQLLRQGRSSEEEEGDGARSGSGALQQPATIPAPQQRSSQSLDLRDRNLMRSRDLGVR